MQALKASDEPGLVTMCYKVGLANIWKEGQTDCNLYGNCGEERRRGDGWNLSPEGLTGKGNSLLLVEKNNSTFLIVKIVQDLGKIMTLRRG